MMQWTALIPIKQGVGGKSRLGPALERAARNVLSARMARHVLGVIAQCNEISQTVILSPAKPDLWEGEWAQDHGRGLNPEIAAVRADLGNGPLLVIHADLPLITAGDIAGLLVSAERCGATMATDRAGQGTNALALADGRTFDFRFGEQSCHHHRAQDLQMPVIQSIGLSADLDTPEDIEFLQRHGFAV